METRISMRWHFTHNGRTYIVYAATKEEAQRVADTKTFNSGVEVCESGYWTSDGNRIVGAKDGDTVVTDNSNGRLSQ